MEFVNALGEQRRSGVWQTPAYHRALETLLALLAPAAPHITEELWQLTGHTGSVHQQPWPAFDPELARDEIASLPVTEDGKVRATVEIPASASQDEAQTQAFANPKVQQFTAGREIARQREIATRLADSGVLVLDAQAIVAAPPDLYLTRDLDAR
jgi:leucyl-tRNA synthetase